MKDVLFDLFDIGFYSNFSFHKMMKCKWEMGPRTQALLATELSPLDIFIFSELLLCLDS